MIEQSLVFSVIAITCLLSSAASAAGTELQARISNTSCAQDELLTLHVEVIDPTQASAPVPDQSRDFDIRLSPVRPNPLPKENKLVVNNRVIRDDSSYTYIYQLSPKRVGALTVPAFTLRDGGREFRTDTIRVRVAPRTGPTDVLCKLIAPGSTAYVGQAVGLTLEIWVRGFQQRGNRPLNANEMWTLGINRATQVGVFVEATTNPPRARETLIRDQDGSTTSYFVYFWELTITPKSPGPLDFGDIAIVWDYPVEVGRRLLQGISHLREPRTVRAVPDLPKLEVKPIPLQGRPPDYNGAIGRFTIQTRAKPTRAPVGDPITLTMVIQGDAPLEGIRPPRLDQVAALTKDFEISGESLAGELEAGRKVFSQTIRALRENVSNIPRIPFSFFDPDSDEYVTAWSEPISVKITPAERLALPANGRASDSKSSALTPLTETMVGLQANCADIDLLLADQQPGFGPGAIALFASAPAVYLGTWFVARRSIRFRKDLGLHRRRSALRRAKKALATAERSGRAGGAHAALIGFVADRCNVPAAGLTRADAMRLLSERRAAPDVQTELNGFLETIEFSEYAGSADSNGDALFDQGRRLLDALERCNL